MYHNLESGNRTSISDNRTPSLQPNLLSLSLRFPFKSLAARNIVPSRLGTAYTLTLHFRVALVLFTVLSISGDHRVEDPKMPVEAKANEKTPSRPKNKGGKTERASLLCSTPPTCIKDRSSHVEYTRKEFLGEVVHKLNLLMPGRFCSMLSRYE
jgi:hypothetical protein